MSFKRNIFTNHRNTSMKLN